VSHSSKLQIEKTVAKNKGREYYRPPVLKGNAKDKKKP
jgi:hypothetical protein